MKRLILTGWGGGYELGRSGFAEIVIPFHFQFAWGTLPPAEKLSAYFAAYTTDLGPADHWSDWVRWPRGAKGRKLSLAEFGKAVLAHREDFSRHNPIDRWWGGTHLTNDRLWRYGCALTKP